MFNAFDRPPKRVPYRSFDVKAPQRGEWEYRSIDLPVPQLPLHWIGRNVPCFGIGCPICPMVARPMVFLPTVQVGTPGLKLTLMSSTLQLEQLAKTWKLGWLLKIKRLEKGSRITEATQSLHQDVGRIEDRDVHETLARMFHLPSPDNYGGNEETWITACIEALKEEMRRPPRPSLPKS